jgi:sec-independent protein translocase protein TatB
MNSFFGLGPMELLVIVFLALIVLGPQRLPGTIREVMKWWRYFRNLSGELTSQLGAEFKDLEDLSPQKILEDLAKELDGEVEQTKEAASLKKKTAPKSKETKPAASKASAGESVTLDKPVAADTASATETTTKIDASPTSDASVSADTSASVEASAAVAGGALAKTITAETETTGSDAVDSDVVEADLAESETVEPAATAPQTAGSAAEGRTEAPESDEATDANTVSGLETVSSGDAQEPPATVDADTAIAHDPAQATASAGDAKEYTEPQTGTIPEAAPVNEPENTILPPIDQTQTAADVAVGANGALGGEREAEEALSEPAASSTSGDEAEPTNGQDQPLAKKPIETVEPAPVSVNGKGTHPEDEA